MNYKEKIEQRLRRLKLSHLLLRRTEVKPRREPMAKSERVFVQEIQDWDGNYVYFVKGAMVMRALRKRAGQAKGEPEVATTLAEDRQKGWLYFIAKSSDHDGRAVYRVQAMVGGQKRKKKSRKAK